MKLLALDTSTWWASVALAEGRGTELPEVVAELGCTIEGSHADHLLELIEALLSVPGWSRDAIDVYVATRGPGSFTGLRVGMGTVRGLSLAANRPAAGVGTLDALAQAHGADSRVRLAVMDAGRTELYCEAFDPSSTPPSSLTGTRLIARAELAQEDWGGRTVVVPAPGTAIEPSELPRESRLAATPRGIAAAAAAIAMVGGLATLDGATLAPHYVRPPDALLKG